MTRLADIDPAEVAQSTHEALMGRLARLAGVCGVTDPLVPAMAPSEAFLAVHQLALYATAGTPPEGRPELVGEYMQDVAQYADWLGELRSLNDPKTPLQVVLTAARAREALRADEPLTTGELATLAGMSRTRLSELSSTGDAPKGRRYPRRKGRPRLFPADEAREWLSGRGVEL